MKRAIVTAAMSRRRRSTAAASCGRAPASLRIVGAVTRKRSARVPMKTKMKMKAK
jgi:hypothetical protein